MDILFSRTVKAGKRIYYVDVKQSKNQEMYLSLTECKKVVMGEGQDARVDMEKHKVFVYREDFSKILEAMHEAVDYIEKEQGAAEPRPNDEIKLDLDF